MRLALRLSTMAILTLLTVSITQAEVTPKADTHYSIYLLAGQSNMDGRAKKKDLTGDLDKYAKPHGHVLIHFASGGYKRKLRTSDGLIPLQPGCNEKPHQFGPELGFGHTLAVAKPKQSIILVKVSEGGTTLHTAWNPETKNGLYHQLLATLEKTQKELKDHGATSEIAGLIWHQGESDSGGNHAKKYGQRFKAMVDQLRRDTDTPKLPTVIGSICADNPKYQTVIEQSKKLAESSPLIHFTSSEGLTTHDANVHFDAPSQIELGQRLAKTLLNP